MTDATCQTDINKAEAMSAGPVAHSLVRADHAMCCVSYMVIVHGTSSCLTVDAVLSDGGSQREHIYTSCLPDG